MVDIRAYIPRVKKMARVYASRFNGSVDEDDLLSAGFLGLLACAEKFDGRCYFWAYARRRIFGRMVDYVRWWLQHRDMKKGKHRSLAAANPEDERATRELKRIDDRDTIDHILNFLPETERKILRLRFLEGMTLMEVSIRVGLSKSRVHQIIKMALDRARWGFRDETV